MQVLMQASINLGHFPKLFNITTTIIHKKPSKWDYITTKAYRYIMLENTLGKVIENIIADIMSYLTETHELLPTQHYDERPGRSVEVTMMILSESRGKTTKCTQQCSWM